jgi:fructosamine-3-kinase
VTRQPLIARRAEELLGASVSATAPVAGGDICTATRLRMSDGRMVLMKTHPHAPEGFFEAEARGLAWLAEAAGKGGVVVPEVLGADHECLVLRWVEPGKPSIDAAEDFGRRLAATHAVGADGFGLDRDGFIGRLPMLNRPRKSKAPSWAEFYATRRVLPYLKLARDRAAISAEQAAVIEGVVGRLPDLVPDEPPARLHGDLWNGNVIWAADGTVAVVDPAAYAGHRETDLAMMSLFGLAHLPRVLTAYTQVSPLADDWQDRVGLHQLFPLLVHACMFGGGYGARAAEAVSDF